MSLAPQLEGSAGVIPRIDWGLLSVLPSPSLRQLSACPPYLWPQMDLNA